VPGVANLGPVTYRRAGLLALLLVLSACTTTSTGTAVPAPAGSGAASSATVSASASASTRASTLATPAPSDGSRGPTTPSTSSSPTAPSTSSTPSAPSSTSTVPTSKNGVGSALPTVALSQVNDLACTSTHRPVILLPGTFSTVAGSYSTLAPALVAAGYCLYGQDFAGQATQAVRTSAAETAVLVDQVLELTGADQVDAIGYSQGGLVLRTALRENGLADKVDAAVLIAPSFHGSDAQILQLATPELCRACVDQQVGSELLTALNTGGDLDGSVHYAVVVSRVDAIVTPYTSQIPEGPADRVRSVVIQDRCPTDRTAHEKLPYDPAVVAWVLTSLAADGLPDPADFSCTG